MIDMNSLTAQSPAREAQVPSTPTSRNSKRIPASLMKMRRESLAAGGKYKMPTMAAIGAPLPDNTLTGMAKQARDGGLGSALHNNNNDLDSGSTHSATGGSTVASRAAAALGDFTSHSTTSAVSSVFCTPKRTTPRLLSSASLISKTNSATNMNSLPLGDGSDRGSSSARGLHRNHTFTTPSSGANMGGLYHKKNADTDDEEDLEPAGASTRSRLTASDMDALTRSGLATPRRAGRRGTVSAASTSGRLARVSRTKSSDGPITPIRQTSLRRRSGGGLSSGSTAGSANDELSNASEHSQQNNHTQSTGSLRRLRRPTSKGDIMKSSLDTGRSNVDVLCTPKRTSRGVRGSLRRADSTASARTSASSAAAASAAMQDIPSSLDIPAATTTSNTKRSSRITNKKLDDSNNNNDSLPTVSTTDMSQDTNSHHDEIDEGSASDDVSTLDHDEGHLVDQAPVTTSHCSTSVFRPAATHWVCSCGEENEMEWRFCGMCCTTQRWTCADCHFDNKCKFKFCGMCGITKTVKE